LRDVQARRVKLVRTGARLAADEIYSLRGQIGRGMILLEGAF